MPWQEGIIYTSNSLPPLLEYLKSEYPEIEYLLTYRINQDGLEHLFGQLRAMCGMYRSFGALSFRRRLRDHILG